MEGNFYSPKGMAVGQPIFNFGNHHFSSTLITISTFIIKEKKGKFSIYDFGDHRN